MREEKLKSLLTWLGCIFMIIFCLAPFIYMITVSINLRPDFLSLNIPFKLTWQNFRSVLTDPTLHFLRYLVNSLVISLASAFFAVLIASLAAYAFTRLRLPAKNSLLFFILAVSMFPQISLVSYLFKFMVRFNWVNTYQALILPYIAWVLPLAVWILVSYFSQIPRELDDAAFVDGCSRWQILWRIVFPVAAPGVFSVFLLAFIFGFNEFMFALMLTTDFHARTVPVGIAMFEGLHGEIPWGTIMAASVIATLPVVVVTIFFQKRIIGGLTRGAVKG